MKSKLFLIVCIIAALAFAALPVLLVGCKAASPDTSRFPLENQSENG